MYTLERLKKMKTVWGCMASGTFGLSVWGFVAGGGEIIFDGFMNEPLPSIVMVAAFFAAIISVLMCLTIRGLEKDIAEQLKCLENR